jgi:hypothetical protein
MKSLIIVGMLALLSACSTTKPETTFQTSGPTSRVHVTGTGKNLEEAKTNGFEAAIEIIVGSVIVTDKVSKNDRLVRDEIAKHSAGYITNYVITNRVDRGNQVTVVMDVDVASSKIHERILGKFSDQSKVSGNKLSDQYQSYMSNRNSGDQVLGVVLRDYPSKAYNLKKGDTEFMLDKDRNAVILVDYVLSWNYNYLKALNEVLKVTEDPKSNGSRQERIFVQSKDPSAWLLGSTDRYFFNDGVRAKSIKQRFTGPITIVAIVRDVHGNKLFGGCSDPIYMVPAHVVDPLIISGNERAEGSVVIKIHPTEPDYYKLNKADKVELTYTSGACYNSN